MGTCSRGRRWSALATLLAGGVVALGALPCVASAGGGNGHVRVDHLTIDRTVTPLGTEPESAPRFGWQLASSSRGTAQASYRILVATSRELLRSGAADVWDSGVVASGDSVDVRYAGPALRSRTRYWWTVRVATAGGGESRWSEPAWWETALRDSAGSGWRGIQQTDATGADVLGSSSVGQTFRADGPFTAAGGRFVEYLAGSNPSSFRLSLYEGGPGGRLLASRAFDDVVTNEWLDVEAPGGTALPAGDYYLEAADLRTSGGGMLGWFGTGDEAAYPQGESYVGGAASPSDRIFRVIAEAQCLQGDWSARWVTLPTDWATPISQTQATGAEQLTGRSLGQTFSADKPFATAEGRFVEYSSSGGYPSSLTLSLYEGGPGGRLVASRAFANVAGSWLALDAGAGRTFAAGDYYLEATELRTSGDGMLGWWAHGDGSRYPGGGSYTDGSPSVGDRVFRITIPDEALPTLRKQITVDDEVVRARAYVTALGLYELRINGRRVGNDILAPGWTDYAKRVKYQVFDVTKMVREGANTLGAMLGDGWYSGTVGGAGRYLYGPRPAFQLQLEVDYADGRSESFVTDESWRGTREGPVRATDVYHGESYDARRELGAWSVNGYDDAGWDAAVLATSRGTCAPRVPQTHVSTTAEGDVPARSVRALGGGRYVFDLGREIGGVVRLSVGGVRGQQVTIRHAPVLKPDGELDVGMLRSARSTDRYTLRGGGTETYQPRFTWHGFRYVEVSGLTRRPAREMVTGVEVNADVDSIGGFATDNGLVNQLQSVLRATHLSHFVTMPIDTPERDERLGWVGEVSVSGGGLLFNYEVDNFIGAWDDELVLAQRANGELPHVVPFVPLVGDGGAYATDSIVHSPYLLWQRYGQTRTLERLYPAMRRWMARLRSIAGANGLLGSASYADHLNLGENTTGGVVENASYVRAARELAEIAAALGEDDDAVEYATLAAGLRRAFQDAYVAVDGRVDGDSQAGYAIAIGFDLMPPALVRPAGEHLARKVAERGGHLVTGYSGTPHVLQALTASGQHAVAERLILRTEYPSWGYMLSRGATTFWERWNSDTFVIDPSSGGNAGMNSFNHLPLATFGDWLYRDVGGLRNDPDGGAGYRRTVVDPKPGAVIRHADTSLRTPYGGARVNWKLDSRRFAMALTVPANTVATVHVPLRPGDVVTESGRPLRSARGVTVRAISASEAIVQVGSGRYRIVAAAGRGHRGG